MRSQSRQIVTILQELCVERDIHMTSFSHDWFHRLEKNEWVTHVFGYDFAINSAASRSIAKDKAATALILRHLGIPVVDHSLFQAPTLTDYLPDTGNWTRMLEFFERHDQRVVCKPNEGTGGGDVFCVRTVLELEAAVHKIFQRHRSLCLSPLIDSARELRFVIVNGKSEVAYEKVRPSVVGDGVSTIAKLVSESGASALLDPHGRTASDANPIDWTSVPAKGERVLLSWRHNLGKGATSRLISEHEQPLLKFQDLAIAASDGLSLRAASVDLFVTPSGAMVLEVNAGIMMENLASQGGRERAIAKRIYGTILDSIIVPAAK